MSHSLLLILSVYVYVSVCVKKNKIKKIQPSQYLERHSHWNWNWPCTGLGTPSAIGRSLALEPVLEPDLEHAFGSATGPHLGAGSGLDVGNGGFDPRNDDKALRSLLSSEEWGLEGFLLPSLRARKAFFPVPVFGATAGRR